MPTEIDKYDSEHKPNETSNRRVHKFFNARFILVLALALIGGLAILVGGGYIKGTIAAIVVFLFAGTLSKVFFDRVGKVLDKREKRIGIVICVVVFGIITGHSIFTPSSENPNTLPTNQELKSRTIQVTPDNSSSTRHNPTETDSLSRKYLESKIGPRIVLVKIDISKGTNRYTSVELAIENIGEAAATKIKANFDICVHTVPIYNNFTFFIPKGEMPDLPPKAPRSVDIPLIDEFAIRSYDQIKAQTLYLYAYGRISYSNEIDESKKYTFEFCWVYDSPSDSFHEIYPARFSYAKKTKPQPKPNIKREPVLQPMKLQDFSAAVNRVLDLPKK